MRPASRFLAGLGIYVGTTLYLQLGAPGLYGALLTVPYAGQSLALAFQLTPAVVAALVWTLAYAPIFGGLVPRPKLEGKKVGTCGSCNHSWELGAGDAVRFWFKTKDVNGEFVADHQCARICPKCGHRLEPWQPVEHPEDAKLPQRLRTPPKYPR